MEFSDGALPVDQAHRRFDHMLAMAYELPFAKQPVVERSSGRIVGYTGVDRFELEGRQVLEWGWRLISEVRGKGYATEAGRILLARAAEVHLGEIVAMVDPANAASRNVAEKLGFAYEKQADVDGYRTDILRLVLGGPARG